MMMIDSNKKEEGLLGEDLIKLEIKKCCADCKTTRTPLWRSGPSGPKSLCNACGIRRRKKRHIPAASTAAKNYFRKEKGVKRKNMKLISALKMNWVMPMVDSRRSPVKKQRNPRQWGEVERAALLLMAISCGAVFG